MTNDRRSFRVTVPLALAGALALSAFATAHAAPGGGHPHGVQPRAAMVSVKPHVVLGAGRGYARLGVQLVDITDELREFYGAPADAGVLVARVVEDSPAAEAGFEVGDVITRLDGELVRGSGEIQGIVFRQEPETEIAVEVVRKGAPVQLTARLAEREEGVWYSGTFHIPDLHIEEFEELGQRLPDVVFGTEEAREAMSRAFERARERMGEFDYGELRERLAEAEDRLRELEKKLAERDREEP